MSENVETVTEVAESETNGASKDKTKAKVTYEARLGREEAVQYFSAILDGLKQGTLTFKQGDRSLTVRPADHLDLEVKASRKGRESKVSFEIAWREQDEIDLEITAEQ